MGIYRQLADVQGPLRTLNTRKPPRERQLPTLVSSAFKVSRCHGKAGGADMPARSHDVDRSGHRAGGHGGHDLSVGVYGEGCLVSAREDYLGCSGETVCRAAEGGHSY